MGVNSKQIVDVILPTRHFCPILPLTLKSLEYLPFKYELHIVGEEYESWPSAVNSVLAHSNRDVLLIDDDVILTEETFQGFSKYLKYGDIIGFKLLHPSGVIQSAGAIVDNNTIKIRRSTNPEHYSKPEYVHHVSASLCYIKKEVYKTIGGFVEWEGLQFEDIDYTLRAIEAGFRVLYVPSRAIHYATFTLGLNSKFVDYSVLNYRRLEEKWLRGRAQKVLQNYKIGIVEVLE